MSSETDTKGPDEKYCASCGDIIKKQAEICPECGVRQEDITADSERADTPALDTKSPDKDRVTAGVLALVLGGLGAHKFYLGKHLQGALYVIFIWTFIPMLLGLVEGILYLTKSDEEFHQKYVEH